MQAAAGHFAGGPEAGERRAAVVIDRHAADHVVGAGPDRDPVAVMSRPNSRQRCGDAGEAGADRFGVEVAQVEIDAGVLRLFHLVDDRLADDVARGELGPRVVVGHEAVAEAFDQDGAFAADGFGDQAAAAAGDVEHRRMELHELHVGEFGAGAVGHGVAVAGGDGRVGRFAIDLPRAAGGENRLLGPDEGLAVAFVPDERAAAAIVAA